MSQVEREMWQAAPHVVAAMVEPRQRLDGEAVAKVVHARATSAKVSDAGVVEQPMMPSRRPVPA